VFAFSVKNGFEPLPLAEAMYGEAARVAQYDASKISVSPYAYLPRGRYTEYLWLYERCFDHNQLYEMIYEQVVSNSQAAAELYALLGLATGHVLAGHSVMNPTASAPTSPSSRRCKNICARTSLPAMLNCLTTSAMRWPSGGRGG